MAVIDGQFFLNAEATAGTYSAPASADILPIDFGDAVFTPAGATQIQTWKRKRSFNYPEAGVAPGQRFWNVAFSLRVKHTTGAGVAPELNQVLEACGFLGTNSEGVSEAYTLRDNLEVFTLGTETASVRLEELTGGKKYEGSGFMGSITLRFTAEGLFCDVAGIAMWRDVADTSITAVADAAIDPGVEVVSMASSAPFTLDTGTTDYEPALHEFTWTQDIQLAPLVKLNATNMTGVTPAAVYGQCRWSALVQEENTTAFDFTGKHQAGTAEPMRLKWTGGSRNLQLDLYRCQYDQPTRQPGSPNLLRIGGNNFGDESNSPITLTFT